MRELIREYLRDASWLVLAGSLAPGTRADLYGQLVETARERGARVLVDTSGPPLSHALASRPDVVKPNRSEAAALLGHKIQNRADAASAALAIHDMGARLVVLSLGKLGAVAANEDGVLGAVPTPARSGCAVGAGDALGAALIWALDRGEHLADALRWAVAAGSATAALAGLQSASRAEVAALRPHIRITTP